MTQTDAAALAAKAEAYAAYDDTEGGTVEKTPRRNTRRGAHRTHESPYRATPARRL